MSTFGLAAFAAMVAAGLVTIVLGARRWRRSRRTGPRTVAELVQLRAEAQPELGSAHPGPAPLRSGEAGVSQSAVSQSAPRQPSVPVVRVDATQAGGLAAALAVSEPAAAATPTVVDNDPRDGQTPRWGGSVDTPWGRARRLGGTEPAERPAATGSIGSADSPTAAPDPAEAAVLDDSTAAPGAVEPGPGSAPAPAVTAGAVVSSELPPGEPALSEPVSTGSAPSGPGDVVPGELTPSELVSGELALGEPVLGEPVSTGSVGAAASPMPTVHNAVAVPTTASIDAPASPRPAEQPAFEADATESATPTPAAREVLEPAPAAAESIPEPADGEPADRTDEIPVVRDADRGPERPIDEADTERPRALRLVPPLPGAAVRTPRVPDPDPLDAADRAVLGALGLLDPDAQPEPVLSASVVDVRSRPEPELVGPAQQIRFRVARRDGSAVPGAGVTLLDHGGEALVTGVADTNGYGELSAPHAGDHLLLAAATGHQPAATTVSIVDGPADAQLVMTRSAVLTGAVHGPHGPVVTARLTLVQDGEIVDAAHSDPAGVYRIGGLAAGGYSLSASAPGCVPVAVRVNLPAEVELRRDIQLERDRTVDVDLDCDPLTMPIPVQSRAAAREAVGHR